MLGPIQPQKLCRKCGHERPLSFFEWEDAAGQKGMANRCQECRELTAQRRRAARLEQRRLHQQAKKLKKRATDSSTRSGPMVAILYRDPCCYCGGRRKITIEHISPFALGGVTHHSNIVAACSKCNQAKADNSPLGFLMDTDIPSSPIPKADGFLGMMTVAFEKNAKRVVYAMVDREIDF